ncbi:MAG TPA: endolytic transglycosylase MltG [candidate division Zixibacteria bacterium]|nr:endolytic transglycosylase MltG [candidate division Zixibacteria bacterium]HEQ98602.1 endolytic transglycosylase MltG [candidate division Zixibacteria bacterium]
MKRILLIILVIALGMLVYFGLYLGGDANPTNGNIYLMVHPGDGAGTVLHRADSLDLKLSKTAAKLYLRIYGAERRIVPGRYTVEPDDSRLDLLKRIRNGEIDYVWITVPEGLTVNRTIEIMADRSGRTAQEFLLLANDPEFLSSLPFSPEALEGYLFPETYKAPYHAEPDYLINIMVNALYEFLDSRLMARAEEIGLDVKELLTLASLIEAETAAREEMPVISSVFHNRLKRDMLLQCDPTVIYALGGLDRPLYTKDLKVDSPYNTYLYKGLPPGPINSPGRDAILAALYPDSTNYLFFVADISGRHVFSATNAEHEKARREIKRKRRLE